MGRKTKIYNPSQKEETQGSEETTGIMSCYVNFLPTYTTLYDPNDGLRSYDWSTFGLIDGDAPTLEQMIKSFQNMTGMIEKLIGNQLTGTGGAKVDVKLKNLTEYGIARSHGGNNNPTIGLSRNPGDRKIVFTFSAAFATGNIFAWSFKTNKISNGSVSSVTAVSTTYATSDAATGIAIETAILLNAGVLSAVYNGTTNTLTVIAKPGYIITNTVVATLTGGSATLISTVGTDTAIVSTGIAAANGAISSKSFGVTTGGGAKIQACIDNGTFDGVPGSPQLRILTGETVIRYEYPHVERVIGDVIYVKEELRNLPADLATVEVVARKEYFPIGQSLPQDVELQFDFRDHSNKSAYIVHVPRASYDPGTKPANATKEGLKANLSFLMIDTLMNVNGVESLRPYKVTTINSAVGTD